MKYYYKLFLKIILTIGLPFYSYAQSAYQPFSYDTYALIDRYEIKNKKFSPNFFSNFKPYKRKDLAIFWDSLSNNQDIVSSKSDQFNSNYFRTDNWDWSNASPDLSTGKKSWFNTVYMKQPDFWFLKTQDSLFTLHVSPVVYFRYGKDTRLATNTYTNTRGIEFRGNLAKKLGYYFYFADNQIRVPKYVEEYGTSRAPNPSAGYKQLGGFVPEEGFWKTFGEDGAVDFLTARGYMTFELFKALNFQVGHDKQFIGNGYRSLILSDKVPPYLFLKADLKIWKFQYTNLWTEMIANNEKRLNRTYPKKHLAYHHLSINITENFNMGVFESVIYSRQDSVNSYSFEPNYLNPLMLYRYMEQHLGDADNAMLGVDMKWNLWGKFQLYGQLMLDEFSLTQIQEHDGWWGNKFAWQVGGKYIDAFGVDNLDLQGELNMIRPYTYAHFGDFNYSNYQHYQQPLAHPLGANLTEAIGIIRYQPIPRLLLTAKAIVTNKGEDPSPSASQKAENWGGDIFKTYVSRQTEYGNTTGQGIATRRLFGDVTATVQIRHNFFMDLKYVYRDFVSDEVAKNTLTQYASIGFRLNTGIRHWDF